MLEPIEFAQVRRMIIKNQNANIQSMAFKETKVNGDTVHTMTFTNGTKYDLLTHAGSSRYLGEFSSLTALIVAHPTALDDSFAIINDTTNSTSPIISIATYNGTLLTWESNQLSGLSAYGTAIKNGFVGTETEWLNSLDSCLGKYVTLSALQAEHPTADVNKFAILVMDNGQVGICFYSPTLHAWDVTVFASENGTASAVDDLSVSTNILGNLQLYGFENAIVDSIPIKKSDGTITYLTLERNNLNAGTAIASKEYVAQLVTGGLILQNDYYNANTNTPDPTTIDTDGKSFAWIVDVAGTQTLDTHTITLVKNDVLIKTSTGGYLKIDNSSQILSWGSISGTIANQTDLIALIDQYAKIDDADITSALKTYSIKHILELVSGKKTIYIQSAIPSPAVKDDIWIDNSVTPYAIYAYDGTVFQEVGGSGKGGLIPSEKNASFTASVGHMYLCDVTVTVMGITMPTTESLVAGDIIEVMIAKGDSSINSATLLTLNANQKLNGIIENFVFDKNSYFKFVWTGITNGWKVSCQDGGVPNGEIAGVIKTYTSLTPPSGYLLCQGQAVSRTTYANLFSVMGTSFGIGNGNDTFNVPDLKSRIPVGYNPTDANFNEIGKIGGEASHLLTVDEMPNHAHTVQGYVRTTYMSNGTYHGLDTGMHAYGTSATGGGKVHNNIQPYTTVSYIIHY